MKRLSLSLLTLLTSVGLSASEAEKVPLSAEDLTKIQQVSQILVSPDGDSVAFTRSVPRELYVEKDGLNWTELYLVDDKGQQRPFITGKVNVKRLSWSADGNTIYFLAKLKDDKFTALYQIPRNGGEAQKVLALKDTNINHYRLSEDNNQVALLAKPKKDKSDKKLKELGFKAEVYEEDLKNQHLYIVPLQASKKAIEPEAWRIEGYVSDVQFGPKGQKLLVKTQPTALIDDKYMKSQWSLFDMNQQHISTFKTEGKLGSAEFSYNGEYIAILGAQDKHDPAVGRLYLGEAKSGSIQNWLPNLDSHVSDIEWANKSNTLYFVNNVGTQSEINTIKAGSAKFRTKVKTGKYISSQLSISDSDKTVMFKGNSAVHPNEVIMLRGRSKTTRLTDSNPWLAERKLAKQETLKFKARDGVELDGVLLYPLDHKEGQTYPLIMTVHGGPESHDKDGWITRYSRPAQMAAGKGYAVFHPNYRGSTGKGVEHSKLGQNDYAGKEFDDLIDAKSHLVDIGLVDPKRVGITGGSYGGYASAWGATKLTDHFAASVMFVGIANQLSKFGTTDISNEMNLVHARSYPWDKWMWYLERSPIYWAEQSKTPLLIMHGKSDPRVHPAQSMELYRYMKVHGKQVRLVYYPGEGHGNRRVAAQYDYSLRLMRWMDNYLMEGETDMPKYEIDHAAKMEAANKED